MNFERNTNIGFPNFFSPLFFNYALWSHIKACWAISYHIKLYIKALFPTLLFFKESTHRPILSSSRNVRIFMYMSPPLLIYFEASQWPSDYMISSTPLIGHPPLPPLPPPPLTPPTPTVEIYLIRQIWIKLVLFVKLLSKSIKFYHFCPNLTNVHYFL